MQFLRTNVISAITSLLREFLEVTASPDAYSFNVMTFEDISSLGVFSFLSPGLLCTFYFRRYDSILAPRFADS
jgi:hypothetical protein